MLRIVWQSSVIFVFVVLACAIEIQLALSQDPSRHPLGGKSTRPNDRTRRIQSWMIKQKAVPKTRSFGKNTRRSQSTSNKQGSLLTFQKPTKANIGRWFGVDEDPGNLRSMLRREFNHNAVGMTNPCLHVSSQQQSADKLCLHATQCQENYIDAVTPASSEVKTAPQNQWWPSLSFVPSKPKKWRVLTYRRKIGTGLECYKRVRDAALNWEFRTDKDMGLLSVPAITKNPLQISQGDHRMARGRFTVRSSDDEEMSENNSLPMHQCIGAARRFVSYSARQVVPFLPKIYSVNPVMVVYDVVDQRGPSTTFSSTAYATMKGHLLRGEERVTVALRDGTEDVEVEIVSVSRAGQSAQARAIWPFIGKMQSTFFESQMDSLQKIAGQNKQSQPSIHYSNRRISW